MAEVLVLVDSTDGTVKKATFELLTAARSLGEPSAVVIGAPGTAAALTAQLGEYGAAKIYVAESDDIAGYSVAPKAEALAAVAAQAAPAAILISSSAENKEVAARLALKLGSGILTDAIGIDGDATATQSIFGGAVTVQAKVGTGTPIVTLRPNSFAPEAAAGAAEVVEVAVTVSDAAKAAKIVDTVAEAKGSRPQLSDASVVVSGGRGIGSAENFSIIENLADALGAAVGASRAVVDAGWVDHQLQVGQTGVTVSPQLYVAVGISGAIQHRAGMQTSKTIVAINKDAEAPIFELADFGVVGDLFTVAPALAEEITKRKGWERVAGPGQRAWNGLVGSRLRVNGILDGVDFGTSVVTGRPESIFAGRFRTTTLGILVLITLIAFEAMAVAPALPTAARELHGIGEYGWAFTGFLAANVLGMVLGGQLSDSRGPRLPLVSGMVAFVAGLVVSGTADTMLQLIAGRVVQGLGGGLLITATYVVIGTTFPESVRPKVFAALASAWVVPSLVGPLVAGTLTEHVGWRWVFLGLLPFVLTGCALMVPVLRRMHPPPRHAASRLADPRRTLRACALAAGVTALEATGQHPSWPGLAVALVGAVALVWGLRVLVPRGTIRLRRGVPAAVGFRGLLAGAFFGVEAIVPLSLTVQHGYSAVESGLPLACAGVTWALGSWWQGRSPRDDEHLVRLVRFGFCFTGLGIVVATLAMQPHLPGWPIYVAWALAGLGAGMAMPTASVQMLKHTTDADRGTDSAALQLADTTASSLTTGLAGVLVAAAARHALGYSTAFTILDVAMAAIAVVGVLAAGQVRAPDPALAPARPAAVPT